MTTPTQPIQTFYLMPDPSQRLPLTYWERPGALPLMVSITEGPLEHTTMGETPVGVLSTTGRRLIMPIDDVLFSGPMPVGWNENKVGQGE